MNPVSGGGGGGVAGERGGGGGVVGGRSEFSVRFVKMSLGEVGPPCVMSNFLNNAQVISFSSKSARRFLSGVLIQYSPSLTSDSVSEPALFCMACWRSK